MNQSSTYLPISPSSHRPRGFTLIEIMITIIIMGILSTLGISTFQSAQKKSRDVKRKADLYTVVKALESYMSDKGVYPKSKTDADVETGKILWCGEDQSTACNWGDPLTTGETVYMASLPKDALTSQTFYYEGVETDGKIKGYKLYARLENDKDQDISSSGQYEPTCRPGDTTNTRFCNYVITSDTVAKPIGCAVDQSSCTLATECCTKACTTFYTASCLEGFYCGTTAPSGYFSARRSDPGLSCSSGIDCCSGTCGSFYVDSDGNGLGETCNLVSVCSTGSTPPSGFASTCCKPEGSVCSLASDCCIGTCTMFYQDSDGDTYGNASVSTKRCGTSYAGYATNSTDCYDANPATTNAELAYPGSTYCGTSNRGDGSFDYDCSEAAETCGNMYYGWSSTCCDTCGSYTCHGIAPATASCGVAGYMNGGTTNTPINIIRCFPCTGFCPPEQTCNCSGRSACSSYVKGSYGTQGCK